MPTVTTPKPKVTEESKEEQRLIAHSSALTTIIQRKRIPALTAYLVENDLSPDFALHPKSTHAHASTLLHLASSLSLPTIVTTLLTLGANPELPNAAGKTAFEIASNRPTRDRFRLARHQLGERRWNWDLAQVGKPLTEMEIQLRDDREQREVADAKAQRAADNKRLADEALKPKMVKSGIAAPILRRNIPSDSGLSEEMRIKIERERRARAAEARFAGKS
jgi:ankyrin repeat and zinc finger domain-containing protein 1